MSQQPPSSDHYKQMKIEPLEVILANGYNFLEGNALKYLMRYKYKNGVDDLKKAKWYLEKLIERAEGQNDEIVKTE